MVLAGALLLAWSMYLQYMTASELNDRFKLTKDIGIIRKCLTFMSLFAFRIISNHPDPSYANLIGPEALEFYKKSGETYNQLGNVVFRDVYGYVEMLQTYFAHSSSYSLTFLRDLYYNTINLAMQKACDKILMLDQTVFAPYFQKLIEEDRSKGIVLMLVLWGMSVLLVLLLHYFYFRPLYLQRRQAVSMLKMLPAWLVQRSPTAYRCVCH
jgi:hypothetical protein